MKWLLKFIPFKSLIIYLCTYLKDNWTSKTETKIDDNAIDKVLHPLLLNAAEFASDPNFSWQDFGIRGGFLIVDFLGEDGINELYGYITEKRNKLETEKDSK